MGKKCYLLYFIIMFALAIFGKSYAQLPDYTWPPMTWPIGTCNNLTSAFGPRNQGSVEWAENDWDDTNDNDDYNYDFHRGVDIGLAGDVVAIMGGTVERVVQTYPNFYIIIRSEFQDGYRTLTWFWRYTHVYTAVLEHEIVSEGQLIASVQTDVPNVHLDVKFYPFGVYAHYSDAWHPMWGLPYDNFANGPTITYVEYSADNTGSYVGFQVNSDDEELDVNRISILLFASREDGGLYDTNELLRSTGVNNNAVDYDNKYNCGDTEGDDDSDTGYNNFIRILPYIFYSYENEHNVQFRFYLRPEVVDNILNDVINVNITVWDCYDEATIENLYAYSTCEGCGGPGTPPPPENITDTPNTIDMSIQGMN